MYIANPTDLDLAKLPQWAQKYIELLRMRLKEAKAELHEHLAAPPSEAALVRVAGHDKDNGPRQVNLPKDSTIVFFLDDEHAKDSFFRDHIEFKRMSDDGGKTYYIVARTNAGKYPSVQPQASNVLRLRLVDEP